MSVELGHIIREDCSRCSTWQSTIKGSMKSFGTVHRGLKVHMSIELQMHNCYSSWDKANIHSITRLPTTPTASASSAYHQDIALPRQYDQAASSTVSFQMPPQVPQIITPSGHDNYGRMSSYISSGSDFGLHQRDDVSLTSSDFDAIFLWNGCFYPSH